MCATTLSRQYLHSFGHVDMANYKVKMHLTSAGMQTIHIIDAHFQNEDFGYLGSYQI